MTPAISIAPQKEISPSPLQEVQIADAEFRAGDMDGQVDFASPAQVLDVAVTAMLGSPGNRPRTLLADLRLDVSTRGASMDVLRLRGLRHDTFEVGGADQFGFAAVPLGQNLGAWRTS